MSGERQPHHIDRARLAAALNAIEAESDGHQALVEAAWALPRGRVIGITGPPGVGKSTLAGRLVAAWRARHLTVAALCIDPSSRRSGGALLGDRLRIRVAGDDPDVFVRSMAARGQLGGLAPRAFEAVTVMREAAERVLVETVGVGQSEIEVARLADLTVVVVQPGSGDVLQFVKAGLMEVFDVLVVNKADLGELADNAARELRSALRVLGRREVPVVTVSAEHGTGIDALVEALEAAAIDPKKRGEALHETVRARFIAWHGEKVVRALGGRAAIDRALAGVAEPSPGRSELALERLVRAPGGDAAGPSGAVPAGARPWHGEVVVDQATAARLVASVAPELAGIVPRALGSGWDNTAWLFESGQETRWVFRFPRRQLAAPLLDRELAVMPRLAPLLPLPVTVARWRGIMDNGWAFGGYRFLEGNVAALEHLDARELLALAPVWGAFLRALHAIDGAALGELLPDDPLGKVDVARRWDVTLSTLDATGSLDAATRAVLARARAVVPGGRAKVVCHGDLDLRHVIVTRAGGGVATAGIIDWGDVMRAEPAVDLALAFSGLDGAARAAFFGAYGAIDGDTEALARFRALSSQAWVLSWALDVGHAEHAAEARRSLARAVA